MRGSDSVKRRARLVAAWLGCGGCGPEVGEVPPLYEPRVCGQDGPVDLLVFDDAPSWTVLSSVAGRWMVLSVWQADGEPFDFDVRTMAPCGGDEVRLPENLWPSIRGDSLLGCDVRDGTFYPLDPHTGEAGEVIGTGLQCDPLASGSDATLLRDVESQTVAVIDHAGDLTRTSIPFALPEDEQPVGPHLADPVRLITALSDFPTRTRSSMEAGRLLLDDDGNLWRFGSNSAAVQVAEGVAAFLLQEEVVVIQRQEHAESELFPIQLLDLRDDTLREGPEVIHLRMEWGYLHLPGAFFDPVDEATYPHPAGVEAASATPEGMGVGYGPGRRLRVWNIETGELLIDRDDLPVGDSFVRVWDDVVTFESDEAGRLEIWSSPLDGSSPELVYRSPPDGWASLVSPDEALIAPGVEAPVDVTYLDLATSASWVLMPSVVSTIVSLRVADSPVFDGQRPVVYWIEDGERSSLSVTLLPERR